jgi:hypothetical protein
MQENIDSRPDFLYSKYTWNNPVLDRIPQIHRPAWIGRLQHGSGIRNSILSPSHSNPCFAGTK